MLDTRSVTAHLPVEWAFGLQRRAEIGYGPKRWFVYGTGNSRGAVTS